METFAASFSISVAQIPAVFMRYLPFSRLVTKKQKKHLLLSYLTFFAVQNILIYTALSSNFITATPGFYKLAFPLCNIVYFSINCLIIRGLFFQHIFVFGMQGSYTLLLHSMVAIVLSRYAHAISPLSQIVIQSMAYVAVFLICLYPLYILLKDSFILNISIEHEYHWGTIWLLPALMLLGNIMATMNGSWISSWRQFGARLAMGAAIFVAWKCVNIDFRVLDEKLALKSANKLLHIQMEAIRQQAATISENDEKMKILRHDIRHNIQMLSSLIEHGELDSADELLSRLDENLKGTKPIVFCKNPVINSAMLVYISRAQDDGIEIISEVDIPQRIPWDSSDIAILFANVLENALLASKKQPIGERLIRISTRYADGKLAISVENRFDYSVEFGSDGLPVSTQQGHGIGMSSVSTIVSKYKGLVTCSYEDGWFSISFMFLERAL